MYLVEVYYKSKDLDADAKQLEHEIHEIQEMFNNAVSFSVITKHLYLLEGDVNIEEAQKIANLLLHDPIVQEYKISNNIEPEKNNNEHIVDVWLKQGVTDPVADTIHNSIKTLNILKDIRVKTAKRFVFENVDSKHLHKIAQRLLVNTTINDYLIK